MLRLLVLRSSYRAARKRFSSIASEKALPEGVKEQGPGAPAAPATAAALAEKEKCRKQSSSRRIIGPVSGSALATLSALAILHARRLYEDKQIEIAIQQGKELEFSPDMKASFMQMLPLRSLSKLWGRIASTTIPKWARPTVYKSWCRAFHTAIEDIPLPLEEYPSLQAFFTRGLKEGARPIDQRENCVASPVDGIVLRYGRITQPGGTVEQVKGFTYSVSSLLGTEPVTQGPSSKISPIPPQEKKSSGFFSFWRSEPKAVEFPVPPREFFYCVIYLAPGDYHRVHSPSDWCVETRRHFSGNLLPGNPRAVRTIQNLYTANERVVLEGEWKEGYMAMALVGATNMGSIELKFEPDLKTNAEGLSEEQRQRVKTDCGYCVSKGNEVATFKMGSTVVLVFEAPGAVHNIFGVLDSPYEGFKFTTGKGKRVQLGQALGEY